MNCVYWRELCCGENCSYRLPNGMQYGACSCAGVKEQCNNQQYAETKPLCKYFEVEAGIQRCLAHKGRRRYWTYCGCSGLKSLCENGRWEKI